MRLTSPRSGSRPRAERRALAAHRSGPSTGSGTGGANHGTRRRLVLQRSLDLAPFRCWHREPAALSHDRRRLVSLAGCWARGMPRPRWGARRSVECLPGRANGYGNRTNQAGPGQRPPDAHPGLRRESA